MNAKRWRNDEKRRGGSFFNNTFNIKSEAKYARGGDFYIIKKYKTNKSSNSLSGLIKCE